MSDENTPSDHQWTRLLAELQRSNQIWGGVARSVAGGGAGGGGLGGGSFNEFMQGLKQYNDAQEQASNQQRRSVTGMLDDARSGFNRGVDNVSSKLKLLGEGSDSALSALKGLARGSFLGAIVSQLIDYGSSMVDNYRKMNDAGQGFSGGMTAMGRAAANGGVTMEEMVRITQKNSTAMQQLGGPSGFMGLASGVRDNIKKYGMLGMTVSQINDLVGDYTETLRVQGRIESSSSASYIDRMTKLATNASILSQAFGQSREEILKQTNAAMRDNGTLAYRATLTENGQKAFDNMLENVSGEFAARTGEAGKVLSELSTQVAGNLNLPGMTAEKGVGKELWDAGLGDVVMRMHAMQEQIMRDPHANDNGRLTDEFERFFAQELKAKSEMLQAQGASGQRFSALIGQLERNQSVEGREASRQRALLMSAQADMTKAALGFENAWLNASGEARLKIYGMMESGINSIMVGFDRFKKNGGLEQLEHALSGAASAIFRLFGLAFSGNFASDVATATEGFLKGVTKVADGVSWLAGKLESHGGTIVTVVGGFVALKVALGALGLFGGSGVIGLLGSALASLVGILGAPALAAIAAGVGAMTIMARAGLNADEGPHRAKLDQIRQQMNVLESELSRAQGQNNEGRIRELQAKMDTLKQERVAENAYLEKILADREQASLTSQRQSIQQDIARLESVSENLRNQNAIDAQKNALKNVNEALDIANRRADAAQQASVEATGRAEQRRTIKQVESYEAALPRDTGAAAIVNSNDTLARQVSALNTVMGGVLRGLTTEEQVNILQHELNNIRKRNGAGDDPALTREISVFVDSQRKMAISQDQKLSSISPANTAAPVTAAVGNLDSQLSGATDDINNGNSRVAAGLAQVVQAIENSRKDGRDQTDIIAMLLNLLRKDTRDQTVEVRRQGE